MARSRVTVALSADGGDELFCGYSGYIEAAGRMTTHSRIPGWIRWAASRGLNLALATDPSHRDLPYASLNKLLGGKILIDRVHKLRGYLGAVHGLDALRPFRSFWQRDEVRTLIGSAYSDPRAGSLTWLGAPIEQIAALDFHEYLPDDVLAKTDRATMAVGLEAREPLLDHRIIDMAFRLPLPMRLGPLGNKHVLRSILYRHVPRELVDRPKQGFAVPISDWMRQLIANGAVHESNGILAAKLGLDRRILSDILTKFSTSDQGKNRLWLLYVLGRWAQRWM
jgi:asparagine synthase (glutamine-hydrolysing)